MEGPTAKAAAATTTTTTTSRPFPTWSITEPCRTMEWNELVRATVSVQLSPLTLESLSSSWNLVIIGIIGPRETQDNVDNEDDKEDTAKEEKEEEPPAVELTGIAAQMDTHLSDGLSILLSEQAKTFKSGAKVGAMTSTLRSVLTTTKKVQRTILMGLGPKQDIDDVAKKDSNRNSTVKAFTKLAFALGKAVANKCNDEQKVQDCMVVLPGSFFMGQTNGATTFLRDFTTSFYQTLYVDNRYRTGANIKKLVPDLKSVTICIEPSTSNDSDSTKLMLEEDAAKTAIQQGQKVATGVCMAKDIVNAPHNVLNALGLADTARRIAEQSNGRIQCRILNQQECEQRNMGSYLAVARGSEVEPQFIHLTYTPPPEKGPIRTTVGLVGKGVLFDTGGYDIKTAMMVLMKFDCGGAAAVLGTARALAALEPGQIQVHFIVPATDNMINSKSYVPSDILTASNGKTIEVKNTDAEGRLTLADALVYADKEIGCDKIVEVSTLTGTCLRAFGESLASIYTLNDDMAKDIEAAAKATMEHLWRMPMFDDYNEQLESKIADLCNIGPGYADSINASLFLQNFVRRKTPFCHIDMPGTSWDFKASTATGYGVKLLTEWVLRTAAAAAAAATSATTTTES